MNWAFYLYGYPWPVGDYLPYNTWGVAVQYQTSNPISFPLAKVENIHLQTKRREPGAALHLSNAISKPDMNRFIKAEQPWATTSLEKEPGNPIAGANQRHSPEPLSSKRGDLLLACSSAPAASLPGESPLRCAVGSGFIASIPSAGGPFSQSPSSPCPALPACKKDFAAKQSDRWTIPRERLLSCGWWMARVGVLDEWRGQRCWAVANELPLNLLLFIWYIYTEDKNLNVYMKSLFILLRHCDNVISLYIRYQTLNVLCTNTNSKGVSFLTQTWTPHWCFHSHSTVASSYSASRYVLPVRSCSWCCDNPGFVLCLLEKSCPESFLGPSSLKSSLQIPQNFVCK